MSDSSDEGSKSYSVDEYAESKQALSRTLDSIRSTGEIGTFYIYSEYANPGLVIGGDRPIRLPLDEDDAQAIKSICQRMPSEHRNRIVVDNTVRNTWELDASKFNLVNKNWCEDFSSRILRDTAKGLGMFELRADPHRLLLYEPGSFFQTHSDSEKEQDIIGTLVICLPSQHEGGDVCLSFESQKHRLSTAKNSEFDLTAMSWYSNVTHEVERLTSGYRLVLTYKLFASGEDKISTSTFSQHTIGLKPMLVKFRTDFGAVEKPLYPLEHLYTKPSLCLKDPKGRDRSVGCCLNEICSEAGFYFMLGQTTHFQVDCDECQDQPTLRILYNLNGDQLSSKLVPDLEDFLDYDIGRKAPHSEDEGGLLAKAEVPRVFHFHKTVAYLMPKEYLDQLFFCHRLLSYRISPIRDEDYFLTQMVYQYLLKTRDNSYSRNVAIIFLGNALYLRVHFFPNDAVSGLISECSRICKLF